MIKTIKWFLKRAAQKSEKSYLFLTNAFKVSDHICFIQVELWVYLYLWNNFKSKKLLALTDFLLFPFYKTYLNQSFKKRPP